MDAAEPFASCLQDHNAGPEKWQPLERIRKCCVRWFRCKAPSILLGLTYGLKPVPFKAQGFGTVTRISALWISLLRIHWFSK
jgi:hypothetical protein